MLAAPATAPAPTTRSGFARTARKGAPGAGPTVSRRRSSSLAEPADLLIWDEPLNFIDVDARELVEQAVLRDTPTLVFVEHDAAFLDQVSTRRIELVPSRRANS